MNTQVNVRMPEKLLASAEKYAEKKGFGNVQDFIRETLRERLFEDREMKLVKKLLEVSEKKGLYGTEKELFGKLIEK